MPIDHQSRPPLLVTGTPTTFTPPRVRDPGVQEAIGRMLEGMGLGRNSAQQAAERMVQEQDPRPGFPQMEIYSNPIIARGEDARRMRDALRQHSARMERAHQMVFGRSEPEAQAAIQRILGSLLARVRPQPEKPPEGPPKGRYERLKSDLPEL